MAQREDVWFTSGTDRVSAWLYRPDSADPVPLLVMAHGLGAVRTMRLDAYAERFSAAGYACLVFDYRNFGDSEGEPRQLLDIDHAAGRLGFGRRLRAQPAGSRPEPNRLCGAPLLGVAT